MTIEIRAIKPGDAETCGKICHAAFHKISTDHNFPPDFSSPQAATGLIKMMIAHPEIHGVVAEADGRIAGSNFLWEQSQVAGVGPITVDPQVQNGQIGRRLMEAVLARSATKGWPSTRLVQAAYHNRSLSLYTKLGFDPCEPLSTIHGPPINQRIPGYAVRRASAQDIDACNRVCRSVHGHDRIGELRDAIKQGSATLVERDGQITGYATVIGLFGHAVGETNTELKSLIAAAPAIAGAGMLVPTRNADLLRWCLAHGLRIVQPMTLMSRGLYNEPKGAFLPSILF